MRVLEGLEPKRVFEYFEGICGFPHGSGNVKAIGEYLVAFAQEQGLWYVQEACGNVIMKKPATPGYENVPPVILQGHMDMVAVKTSDCQKDMTTDGLDLFVEGDLIGAKGTSLGGDDGIALAYAMAILASDDIPHPAITFVATVDEETGMYGAADMDVSYLEGTRFINIDSEEEGILLVGCAGGLSTKGCFDKEPTEYEGHSYRISLQGLRGGHSGVEIHKNHANAILLLADVLHRLVGKNVKLIRVTGGEKDNAIPDAATAEVLVCGDEENNKRFTATADKLLAELLQTYQPKEPNMQYTLTDVGEGKCTGYSDRVAKKLLAMLVQLPYGVRAMTPELPDLVETSNNVGLLWEEGNNTFVCCSARSSEESHKLALCGEIEELYQEAGATAERLAGYPGWAYRKESPLRELFVKKYTEQYGEPPLVQTIHAGLECGLFLEKKPELDAISFGPNIYDIHSTRERLSIASTERTWRLLLAMLAER